uniref:Monodehydroascorbate reductase n=1 Tax=Tanacetum cinerariifolium TaxID=118510 RepID=A0A6L2JEA1_TANCI|nr:hypothetical protein [Tanacetum cinerariifolium]
MSYITAQQAKLNLELVPKEKRHDIRKCNERLNPRKIQRKPTFQVVLDALGLTPCYSAFLITADVPEVYMYQFWDSVYKHDTFYRFKMDKGKRFKRNMEIFIDIFKICPQINSLNDVVVDHMHQPWRTFAALINRSLSIKTTGLDNLCLSRAQILWDKTLSWRNKIRMHTSRDDYLVNTLRFVFAKKETQIYGAILPESLTSPEMKEIQAYKTYLVLLQELYLLRRRESSRSQPLLNSLLKSMRDFHKTHSSGLGIVTKTDPSASKIKPSITNEGTCVKPGVPDVSKEESSENNENESDFKHDTDESESASESDHEGSKEDEEEVKEEFVKTPSNDSDDEDETKITAKSEGDEDEKIDYTTSQLYDDVDIRLNEPVNTHKGYVQEEGTNAAMTNIQQGNENPEILQVIEDAYVTLSTVPQKTEVLVTSSSHSFNLAAKFFNFSDIPHTDAEIVSPMNVYVHHEVPSRQTPTLLIVPFSVISDSSPVFPTVIPQSLPSFTPPPQQLTSKPPPIIEAINPPSILPDFASVFQFNNRVTSLEKEMVKESLEDTVLAKESSQPQSSYEAAVTLTKFELKKILIDKIDKSKSYLAAPEHRECYEGLIKSYELNTTIFSTYGKVYSLKRSRKDKDEDPFAGSDQGLKKRNTSKDAEPSKEEPKFEVADSDMPQDQKENLGNDDKEPKEKVASKRDLFTKPTQPQEPTDPNWNIGKTP